MHIRHVLTQITTPSLSNRRDTLPIMEGEKKRIELQNRVYRARLIIPMHIPFRVFEDPRECVEAEEIVKRLVLPSRDTIHHKH